MNEHALYGAWKAIGLCASVHHGKHVFVCTCGDWKLELGENTAKCPHCNFTGTGQPWDIAAAFAARETKKPEADGKPDELKNLSKDWQDALFHPARRRPKSVPIYYIGGTPVCFAGDITVIEAQVKSGKTAFVGAAISSVFAEGSPDCLGWKSSNSSSYAVLHFDTEQSGDDHDSLCERIWDRSQSKDFPNVLLSACVTGFSLVKLKAVVELALENATKICGGVHSVIIDGIADFVSDVNDPESANAVIKWLMATAAKWHVPIIVVLHLNPITSKTQIAKARGHLGSQLYRKAAHVLRIEKDGDGVSTVTSVHARKAQVPKDSQPVFSWSDEKRRHISCGGGENEKHRAYLADLARKCFPTLDGTSTYSELQGEICRELGCAATTAKNTLADMRIAQVVIQGKGQLYSLAK